MNNLVYYDAAMVTAPLTIPRVGPKCGSHRTEEVGHSTNGETIASHCNAGDARSEVTPEDDRAAEVADVTAELEAILAIGQALARLHNPDGRRRVLNWALERFSVEPDANVVAPAAPTADAALLVEDLTDLFDGLHGTELRASDGLDETLDDLFDLPALAPHEEIPSVARDERRLNVLVPDLISALRRFALGVRAPDTLSVTGRT